MMSKHSRYIDCHVLRIDSICVLGAEGILNHAKGPRQINIESRVEGVFAKLNAVQFATYLRESVVNKPTERTLRSNASNAYMVRNDPGGRCSLCGENNRQIFKNYHSFCCHFRQQHLLLLGRNEKNYKDRSYDEWYDKNISERERYKLKNDVKGRCNICGEKNRRKFKSYQSFVTHMCNYHTSLLTGPNKYNQKQRVYGKYYDIASDTE